MRRFQERIKFKVIRQRRHIKGISINEQNNLLHLFIVQKKISLKISKKNLKIGKKLSDQAIDSDFQDLLNNQFKMKTVQDSFSSQQTLKIPQNKTPKGSKLNFEANQKQILVLWLMKLIPYKKVLLNLEDKQIIGSKKQCQFLNREILNFVSGTIMKNYSNVQFSNNLKLYLKNKFQIFVFQKSQILQGLKEIKQFMAKSNLPPNYQAIRQLIMKQKCMNLVVIQKKVETQAQKEIKILLDHKIEPSRTMIKKKQIPGIISLSMESQSKSPLKEIKTNETVTAQNSNSDSDEDIYSSGSEDENTPTFYTQSHQSVKKYFNSRINSLKIQEAPNTKFKKNTYKFKKINQKEIVEVVQEKKKEKQILFYKEIESKYFQLNLFRKWIKSNPYLQARDFYFETDFQAKKNIIKMTNQFENQNKLPAIQRHFNYQVNNYISIFTKAEAIEIAKKFSRTKLAYKCSIKYLQGFKKDRQLEIKIIGYKPCVQKIERQVINMIDSLQNSPIVKTYQLDLGNLLNYYRFTVVRNLIIFKIGQKLQEQQFQYISQIHKFEIKKNYMKLKVKIKNRKQYYNEDKQLESYLQGLKIIHETELQSDNISKQLKQKYQLIPNIHDISKLVMVCQQQKCISSLIEIMRSLSKEKEIVKEYLMFRGQIKLFVKDHLEKIEKLDEIHIGIEENQNKIYVTGLQKTVKKYVEKLQKELSQLQSSLKTKIIQYPELQFSFLKKSLKNYLKQVGGAEKIYLSFDETKRQIEIIYKENQYLSITVNRIQKLLDQNRLLKGIDDYKSIPEDILNQICYIQGVQICKEQFANRIILKSYDKIAISSVFEILKLSLPKQLPQSQKIVYPSYWQKQNKDIELFDVLASSNEFRGIQGNFKAGLIIRLQRIQNIPVYNFFMQQKKYLKEINNSVPQTKMLFHGTSSTEPKIIYQDKEQTFNVNYTGEKNYLGFGVYFAVSSQYSHSYAYKITQTRRAMLYCEVITGQPQNMSNKNNYTMKDTDYKDPIKEIRYESATCFTNGSDIYAIYKSRRAYPHYLIEYERAPRFANLF